jgi:arylformamidase
MDDAITRRTLLAGTTSAVAALTAPAAALGQTKVFLDYDQAALDRAYDQAQWAPNMQQVLKRRAVASDAARGRIGGPRTFSYGVAPIETLDLYPTSRPYAPIAVFLHGGAWRGGQARDCAYAAETFVHAGAHYAVPEFAAIMDVGLDGMVAQVRRAVAWLARNATTFGGDPGRIHVIGHSSGGHLAGNVLVTDWKDFGLPPDTVNGGLCISGMYDLKPVRLSARASYVKFDDRIEHDYSPQRHLGRLACPVIVAYGDQESPEFQRQSVEFARTLEQGGRLDRLIVGQGHNHFELPETLASPYGLLGRAVLEQMKLV